MSVTAKTLVPGVQLSVSLATCYTAPANRKAVIKAATVCNSTSGAVPAVIHLVPPAGSPQPGNVVVHLRAIAPNETYSCPELVNHVLESGGTIRALGDGLSLTVSGVEIV